MPRPVAKRSRVATTTNKASAARLTKPQGSNSMRKDYDNFDNGDESISGVSGSMFRIEIPAANASRDIKPTDAHRANHETPITRRDSDVFRNYDNPRSNNQTPTTILRQQVHGRLQSVGSTLPAGNKPGDAHSRVQKPATPSFESSVLSVFRPRPRQASILQIVGNDSSGLEDEDFLGHLDTPSDTTPVSFSNSRAPSLDAINPSPAVRQNLSLSKSLHRHSLIAVEIPVSNPARVCESQHQQSRSPTIYGDPGSPLFSEVDRLPLMEITRPQLSSSRRQTMASPESSCPASTPNDPSSRWLKARIGKCSAPNAAPRQEPSSEHIDNPHVSTATLQQTLLPQRHHRSRRRLVKSRNKGPIDFGTPNKDLSAGRWGDDELIHSGLKTKMQSASRDELSCSYMSGPNKNNTHHSTSRGRKTGNGRGKQHKNSKVLTRCSVPHNETRRSLSMKNSRAKRTYSHYDDGPADANKENYNCGPVPSLASKSIINSKELLLLKEKFAEIDQWAIEFEDIPVGGELLY